MEKKESGVKEMNKATEQYEQLEHPGLGLTEQQKDILRAILDMAFIDGQIFALNEVEGLCK